MLSERIKRVINLLKEADKENREYCNNNSWDNFQDSISRSGWEFHRSSRPEGPDILYIGNFFGGGETERSLLEIDGVLVIIEDTGRHYRTAYGDVIDSLLGKPSA